MTLSRGSLGGQNTGGRTTGARSSRALSTIFQRLRKLDRDISRIDKLILFAKWDPERKHALQIKRERLDIRRTFVRWERKRFGR